MKLFSATPFPPGGFPFSQVWKGKQYDFADMGLDINQQAIVILKFRKANGIPRASFEETVSDLNEFTCQRLGNDSRWCGNGARTSQVQQVKAGGCKGCGAPV